MGVVCDDRLCILVIGLCQCLDTILDTFVITVFSHLFGFILIGCHPVGMSVSDSETNGIAGSANRYTDVLVCFQALGSARYLKEF